MKELAPRSRERSQLRTDASPTDKYTAETLGMAGICRYNTAFLASLDVKTAFDVAKPAVVSRILTLTRVHGHVAVALLAEM